MSHSVAGFPGRQFSAMMRLAGAAHGFAWRAAGAAACRPCAAGRPYSRQTVSPATARAVRKTCDCDIMTTLSPRATRNRWTTGDLIGLSSRELRAAQPHWLARRTLIVAVVNRSADNGRLGHAGGNFPLVAPVR